MRSHPAARRWFTVASLAVALCCSALCHARLVIMHGYADYTSATLWVQTDGPGTVTISLIDDAGASPREFTIEVTSATDFATSLRVPKLAPGKQYAYRVSARGESREGVLRTQRYAIRREEAPQLAIAFGSCHFLPYPNPAFPANNGGDYQIFDAIAA